MHLKLFARQTSCFIVDWDITPLVGKMKKKQQKTKTKTSPALPIGRVITELALWDFTQDEAVICHNANELARALYLSYNLENFGTASFGLSEDEEG